MVTSCTQSPMRSILSRMLAIMFGTSNVEHKAEDLHREKQDSVSVANKRELQMGILSTRCSVLHELEHSCV
jgi:hypothetical protein